MKRKKLTFAKRAIVLGTGALVLFIIVVLATYPYERAIGSALARLGEQTNVTIAAAQTVFFFPNEIAFFGLKVVPKEQPYHLLETEFRKLTTEIGLRALLTRNVRVRFDGEVDSGASEEGNYSLAGTICLRKGEPNGAGGSSQAQVVELQTVRLTGSDVNLTIDGNVIFREQILDPVVDLNFSVEMLERTDSANYVIDNILRFVSGCLESGVRPPAAFGVSGPFSRLTIRREKEGQPTAG